MSKKRGGNYKLVFRPAEYYGPIANQVKHLPEHEKPLITFHNNTLQRCYKLVQKYKVVWAGIYKEDGKATDQAVAIYTAENEWNNKV